MILMIFVILITIFDYDDQSKLKAEIMGRVPGEESINKYPIISVNTRLFLAALAPHLNFENLSLTSCDAILLVQDSSFLEL